MDVHPVASGIDPDPRAPRRRICRICAAEILLFGLREWWVRERKKGFLEPHVLARPDCPDGSQCPRQRNHGAYLAHLFPLQTFVENSPSLAHAKECKSALPLNQHEDYGLIMSLRTELLYFPTSQPHYCITRPSIYPRARASTSTHPRTCHALIPWFPAGSCSPSARTGSCSRTSSWPKYQCYCWPHFKTAFAPRGRPSSTSGLPPVPCRPCRISCRSSRVWIRPLLPGLPRRGRCVALSSPTLCCSQ